MRLHQIAQNGERRRVTRRAVGERYRYELRGLLKRRRFDRPSAASGVKRYLRHAQLAALLN